MPKINRKKKSKGSLQYHQKYEASGNRYTKWFTSDIWKIL